MSNPFEGARSADMPVDSSDGWSTRDSRRRAGPAMQFNAYDANGVRYTKEKAMTSTSQATSTIGAPSVASVASGPSRPAVNASRPAPTASRPAPAAANQPLVVTVNQNTGWAKPVSFSAWIHSQYSGSIVDSCDVIDCTNLLLTFRLAKEPNHSLSKNGHRSRNKYTVVRDTTPAMTKCRNCWRVQSLTISIVCLPGHFGLESHETLLTVP